MIFRGLRALDFPRFVKMIEIPRWVGVAWFSALFVFAIGITNGDTPQSTYLLYGLRLADSNFLPGDWFTWDIVHSHPAFSGIVALLTGLGSLSFGLTLGAVLQNVLFPVAFYSIIRSVYDRPLLPWAAALVLFAGLQTKSLGSEPWLSSFLGVSSLAGVALVVAWSCLARGRMVAAGFAFGFSGLIHAHFVALCIPLLVAVSLAAAIESNASIPWRKLSLMWSGFLLVSLPSSYQIFRFAVAPGAEEIHWLTEALFPYHVAPWTWRLDPTLMLLGSVLLGTGGLILRPPHRHRLLEAVTGMTFLMVFGSLALAYPRLVELAAQAWPWRLSPLILVTGFVAGMAAVLSADPLSDRSPPIRQLGFGCLLAGVVAIAGLARPPVSYVLLVLASLPAVAGVSRLAMDRWGLPSSVTTAMLALTISISFVPLLVRSAEQSHVNFRAERPQRGVLYEWVRAETPVDAVFAIPPTWEKFRTIARRPVFVDWKAVPRHPPDRIEWLRRIQSVTGVQRPSADGKLLDKGYARMDCELVREIGSDYGVRFVVHEKPKELPCGQLVYEDEYFKVWDLQDPTASVHESIAGGHTVFAATDQP